MKHQFRPIPGFPDYEISNTGYVLSLPRTVPSRDGRTRHQPGTLIAPWSQDGHLMVAMIAPDGVRRNRTVCMLLREIWSLPLNTAQMIANLSVSPHSERPQPIHIWSGPESILHEVAA